MRSRLIPPVLRCRVFAGVVAGSLLLPVPLRAAEIECSAWPGEPNPLPRVDDEDPFLAEWAQIRAGELTRLAGVLESLDPIEAHRFWLHALCLDPTDEEAEASAERTRPRVVHRPSVAAGPADRIEGGERGAAPTTVDSAVSRIAVRIVPASQPVAASSSRPAVRRVDAALAQVREFLRIARFEEARERSRAALRMARSLPDGSVRRAREVNLGVLQATAEVALGQVAAARGLFVRALELDRSLRLDPLETSPKVFFVFEDARAQVEGRAE